MSLCNVDWHLTTLSHQPLGDKALRARSSTYCTASPSLTLNPFRHNDGSVSKLSQRVSVVLRGINYQLSFYRLVREGTGIGISPWNSLCPNVWPMTKASDYIDLTDCDRP